MCGRNFPRRLIFIRHGESEANVNRKITATVPDHDLHLTERGRQQAAEAGQRLASLVGEGSVRFTYSPYTRARETLNGILRAGALEKWPCQEDVRIREQEFGNYDSPEIKEYHKEKASFGPFYYRFRDGESPADCWDRASSYLETLRQSFADETAENHVIVGHGTMLMVMLMRFFQLPVGDFDFYKSLQNCEFVVCERKKDDPKFELSYTWPPGEDKNYAGLRFKTEELPQKEIWDGNLDSCMLSHETEVPKQD